MQVSQAFQDNIGPHETKHMQPKIGQDETKKHKTGQDKTSEEQFAVTDVATLQYRLL